jgi:hypothetical protein
VSSDGHITVSLSRSRINSKFSSEISLYISAWSHFYITITRKYLLHIYVLNLHVKAKAAVNYLNPFPIQVKACDHHSFCKVLLLLPVKRMNPFKCCYSYNTLFVLMTMWKLHLFAEKNWAKKAHISCILCPKRMSKVRQAIN